MVCDTVTMGPSTRRQYQTDQQSAVPSSVIVSPDLGRWLPMQMLSYCQVVA